MDGRRWGKRIDLIVVVAGGKRGRRGGCGWSGMRMREDVRKKGRERLVLDEGRLSSGQAGMAVVGVVDGGVQVERVVHIAARKRSRTREAGPVD
jgi:hypothetical protein